MKSFGKKLAACTLALVSFITMAAAPASAAGWRRNSAGWRYENPEGDYSRDGFVNISGEWYFFDADGYMKTGWQKSGDNWYYLTEFGAMAAGWTWINGDWYYLDPSSGAMKTGLLCLENDVYLLGENGTMQTGEVETEGGVLVFGSDGRLIRADYALEMEDPYSYDLPEGWLVSRAGSMKILYPGGEVLDGSNVILAGKAREEDDYDGYDTVSDFMAAAKTQLEEELKAAFPDAAGIRISARQLFGLQEEAVRFQITYRLGGVSMKQEETVLFLEKNMVFVNYTAVSGEFQKFSIKVESLIRSIAEL